MSFNSSSIESPIDLNKPIENPLLVKAIAKHQSIGSNETAEELFKELKKSVFLVGMITTEPLNEKDGDVLFKKGEKLGLITVLDNENNSLLGLFTDHKELSKFTDKANSTLVMPTKMAFEAIIQYGYRGVVINPASQTTLRLDKEFITTIMGQFK